MLAKTPSTVLILVDWHGNLANLAIGRVLILLHHLIHFLADNPLDQVGILHRGQETAV
jgi:hypothetical protein